MSTATKFDKIIGIIGGGQLGKMLIESGQPWNIKYIILENDPDAPASSIANAQITGKLTDGEKIRELASKADVLTYEIEHIDVETLLALEKSGKQVFPSPQTLQIIKDKGIQKQFYKDHGIPTADFRVVDTPQQWLTAVTELDTERFAAKSCTDGYDGKGVALLTRTELARMGENVPFAGPTMIEKYVPCKKELSVIVARDQQRNMITFPLVEMEFDPQANLVELLACPAEVTENIRQKAEQVALDCIEKLNGIGLFAVELFLTETDEILVNEIAPRPHNSGHHTIEASYTSQYEQLNRILCGLPLGNTDSIQPAVMLNLLGAENFSGPYAMAGLQEVLQVPGVYLHLYGKKESRPKRKMGHITILAATLDEAKEKAKFVRSTLTFIPA